MSTAKFNATRKEFKAIGAIGQRAHDLAKSLHFSYPVMDAEMDVTTTNASGCPLDLERLLSFDDENFGHDVFGIRRHIDRNTGALGDFFLPRCARADVAVSP